MKKLDEEGVCRDDIDDLIEHSDSGAAEHSHMCTRVLVLPRLSQQGCDIQPR